MIHQSLGLKTGSSPASFETGFTDTRCRVHRSPVQGSGRSCTGFSDSFSRTRFLPVAFFLPLALSRSLSGCRQPQLPARGACPRGARDAAPVSERDTGRDRERERERERKMEREKARERERERLLARCAHRLLALRVQPQQARHSMTSGWRVCGVGLAV